MVNKIIPDNALTIFSIWDQIVHEKLRGHSEVYRCEQGVIIVSVDSSAHLQYAQLIQKSLEQDMRNYLKEHDVQIEFRGLQFIITKQR